MPTPNDLQELLIAKALEDSSFRERLIAAPKVTIEQELGINLDSDHEIRVHDDSYSVTHLVLPPPSKYTKVEREEAKAGVGSLEFLRQTLHDPAPPMRTDDSIAKVRYRASTRKALLNAGRESIQHGLAFVETTLDSYGAWHCIRFNVADSNIPRHYERPPFISALCVLALISSNEERAKAICSRTKAHLVKNIEYPGLWRYYRHLPNDLDSTALCSLVLDSHPWILFGRNRHIVLGNRDSDGRFMTWVHEEDEPNVVAPFRIEADPVVNANVIAYLGDRPETKKAQSWLMSSINDGSFLGASKWYPDPLACFYAVSRAIVRTRTTLDEIRPILAERILDLRDDHGQFGNSLQTAQAVSALYNIGSLEKIDAAQQLDTIIAMQREDGSWPELLAFGDQTLSWGTIGQIGHGSEAVTSAFCIEALERLVEFLRA